MVSLSELLFGPLNLPSALPGESPEGGSLPQPGAFARTLTDARAALGLPVSGHDAPAAAGALPLPGQQPPALPARELPGAAAGAQMPGMPGLAVLSFTVEDPHALPGVPPVAADPALISAVPATLPGLPQPEARPATSAERDTVESLPAAASEPPAGPAALPAMLSADARGPWALRMAVRATTTEGTGQGSPNGNGLPPTGPEGGKALPDLPPARPHVLPAGAADDSAAATARTPADVAAALSAAAAERQTTAKHPAMPAVPAQPNTDQPAARGAAAAPQSASVATSPLAQEAAALARLQQERGALLEPHPQRGAQTEIRLPGTQQPVQQAAGTAAAAAAATAAERPTPATSQPNTQAHTLLGATSVTAAGVPQPGTPGTPNSAAATSSQAPLPAAMPETAVERPSAGPQSEAARQLGAVELRALDPTLEGATDGRRPAGADLPTQGQPGLRQEAAAQVDSGAVAAVIDRRTIAEAAGQRRGAEQQASAAAESVDRSPATGTEAAEHNSRPQTARPAVPTLAARDLSALAERIEMLVHRRSGLANVNLTLSELGDVEISVRMESRQAHVQFLVQDATARESLEAQLPRLRDLLSEGGLQLGDVGMNMRERSGGEAGGERDDGRPGSPRTTVADGGSGEDPSPRRRSGGDHHVLDAFA